MPVKLVEVGRNNFKHANAGLLRSEHASAVIGERKTIPRGIARYYSVQLVQQEHNRRVVLEIYGRTLRDMKRRHVISVTCGSEAQNLSMR